MKRWFLIVSCALLCAALMAGCRRLYPDESLSVKEHNAPFAFRETTAAPTETADPPMLTASNYYELRSVLRSFVSDGVEHGEVFVRSYSGNLEDDLKKLIRYLTEEDPVSAYATDYVSCERMSMDGGWMVSVNAVYRRSVGEIREIQPVRGSEEALSRMLDALRRQENSVTLQVSGYTDGNFAAQLRQYILYHPDEVITEPQISVSVYPDAGLVRVVEVHFVYPEDRETLRGMRTEAEAVLDSAFHYIDYGRTDQQKLRLLFTYLTTRFSYREDENASVYSLLCGGVGSSRTAASVVRLLCEKTGVAATLVEGTREGKTWYWNIVSTADGFRHVDLHADALSGGPLTFRTDSEMAEYTWERAACPVCAEPQPEEESGTEETVSESETTAETGENN